MKRIFVILLVLLICLSGCPTPKEKEKEIRDFTATFLDVGQGDAILLELPNGKVILVDGGNNGDGDKIIVPFLKKKGIDTIDLVVLTHPHADHCGGLDEVLEQLKVKEIWENGERAKSKAYKDFAKARKKEKATLKNPKQNDTVTWGDVKIKVLNTNENYEKKNNDSIVLMVSYGDIDVLLGGDIEGEEQQDLVDDYGSKLESEIVKVPHHGSKYYDKDFVKTAKAKHAVFSTGKDNRYGHPVPKVIKDYKKNTNR